MKWYKFDQAKGSRQKRPKDGKWVLVMVDRDAYGSTMLYPEGVAVGYVRYASGDRQCPMFVVPQFGYGASGKVVAWCDCLPEDYKATTDLFIWREQVQ